jgi:hypothetical protein
MLKALFQMRRGRGGGGTGNRKEILVLIEIRETGGRYRVITAIRDKSGFSGHFENLSQLERAGDGVSLFQF